VPSRQRRGRDTERAVAEYLRDVLGWPDATACDCYAPGPDITGVPWSVEIKARSRLDIAAGLRQAEEQNPALPPLLIVRPNGAPNDPGTWWAISRVRNLRRPT
jgi:hypothetical protein